MLKHIRNWSFDTLEREVRADVVYRMFTRVGAEKVPDAKTLARIECALGAEIIEKIPWTHRIAQERKVVKGQRIRLDTTVTETNIHYPTDSSLLGDGVRVLTRTMKRIVKIAQGAGERVRNRMRSVSHRVMELRAPAVARYKNSRRNDCRKATNNYSIRLARLSRKRNELLRKWTMASKGKKEDRSGTPGSVESRTGSDDSGHSTSDAANESAHIQ